MHYWLMKSEPETFSIDDLASAPHKINCWDGVRNYQARNFMRSMEIDDKVFFYHSNCKVPGIVGIAKVVKKAYPDFTAWDKHHMYYDPKSSSENPRWEMVDIQFVEKFKNIIPLQVLYHHPILEDMPLVRKGNRLSIMPVTEAQWNYIVFQILPKI